MALGLRILIWCCFLLGGCAFLTNFLVGVPGVDGSIFYYVAGCLGDGLLPYRDVFDQKGLLIYLLDWLVAWNVRASAQMGTWCWTAWILDLSVYGGGLCVLWRCMRVIFLGAETRICLSVLSVITVYYQFVTIGGNMPEMWIMILSGLAYLFVLKTVRQKTLASRNAFFMGICVGMILMLKLNMITVVLPIAIVVLCVDTKKTVVVLCGVVLVLLPVLIWYAYAGALESIWEVYVQYNATYAMYGGRHQILTLALWPAVAVLAINVYACVIAHDAVERSVLKLNFLYLAVTLIAILASGGGVRYYGPVLPAMVVPLVWGARQIRMSCKDRFFNVGLQVLSVGCLLAMGALVVKRNWAAGHVRTVYAELRELGQCIEDRASVTVLGCDCYAYLALGATCPGRFPFQGTVAQRSPRYRQMMIEDLRMGKSRYLVAPKGVFDATGGLGVPWAKKPVEENYRLLAKGQAYDIYEWEAEGVNRRAK